MSKNEINERNLEKVSGGNDMVINEERFADKKEDGQIISGMKVTYKCPSCGHEYGATYVGGYATRKGYPATTCPNCHKSYWGGEELVK